MRIYVVSEDVWFREYLNGGTAFYKNKGDHIHLYLQREGYSIESTHDLELIEVMDDYGEVVDANLSEESRIWIQEKLVGMNPIIAVKGKELKVNIDADTD